MNSLDEDRYILEFCELCKTTGYKNFEQKIFSFFKQKGFSEDEIDKSDLEFSIIDKIFTQYKDFISQFKFIEQNIDPKDRKIFYQYYIEIDQQEVIVNFLKNMTSKELVIKFNEIFSKKIDKTGFELDLGKNDSNKLYDNILFKIVNSDDDRLEQFIKKCYKKYQSNIKKDPDYNEFAAILDEIIIAAPHILQHINTEKFLSNKNLYEYLSEEYSEYLNFPQKTQNKEMLLL